MLQQISVIVYLFENLFLDLIDGNINLYFVLSHFYYREKILRLEHENKMLKLKSNSTESDDSQVLQSMLDDTNSRKNELETELRLVVKILIMHFKFPIFRLCVNICYFRLINYLVVIS